MHVLTENCRWHDGIKGRRAYLLEFSSQVWSPHYKYLIDKIESVQRYFTKRLFGFSKLSYNERLISLDLDTLECRRLIYDLILCYKMIHGRCVISLPVDYACSSVLLILGSTFLAAGSSMLGIACQTML